MGYFPGVLSSCQLSVNNSQKEGRSMAARLPCHGPVGIIISYLANTSQRQRREVDGAIFHLTRSTFFPFFFSKKTQIHPHEHKTEYTKFYSQLSFELRSSVLDRLRFLYHIANRNVISLRLTKAAIQQ